MKLKINLQMGWRNMIPVPAQNNVATLEEVLKDEKKKCSIKNNVF